MKKIVLALIVALGLGSVISGDVLAAPVAGAPIAQAATTLPADGIQQVWYDRFGRWHPNRPIVRRGPVVVVPRGPVCRSVRVCGPRGCYWTRRC